MKHISSPQNTIVKQFMSLQSKARIRTEKKQFVVEGRRELQLARSAAYEITTIFWCPDIFANDAFLLWKKLFNSHVQFISVSLEVYQKIVVRDSTEGVVGILNQKRATLSDWKPKASNPLVLVLESVEKPGNLGAILRTADAAGVDAVIVTEQHTDIHNPNVIRSSVGGFFSVPIYVCSNDEAKEFLTKNHISIFAASLQKSVPYTSQDYTQPTAFVMGSEATGLSAFWYNKDMIALKIPMLGNVDSLNVSVATSIFVYETLRQRNE